MELLQSHAAFAGKIQLAERLHDPHVHGKGFRETISEKQNAIGNLPPDTRQLEQFGSRLSSAQRAQQREVNFATNKPLGGAEEIRRAKTHFARAQIRLGARRNPLGSGKCERRFVSFGNSYGPAKPFAEQTNDLLDLHDLFCG